MNLRNCFYRMFFVYQTERYISVNCKVLGLINIFLYLSVFLYIFGYILLYEKGYQERGEVESAVSTKVKGVVLTNYSREEFQIPESYIHLYNRLWDVSEYVVPASENDAFFIMTNAVITPNQTYGTCDEDPDVMGAECGEGKPVCKPGYVFELGNGVATGKCINSTHRADTQVCEIEAWCPIENDIFPLKGGRALLEDSKYYTVLIKNRIYFPKFGNTYKRSNILTKANIDYLRTCHYDKEKHPFCPIFKIKNIVEAAGQNFTEVAVKGAVIAIQVVWNCDLDRDFMKHCNPKYSFHRLDNTNTNLSLGWNFRHSYHHEFGRRTLIKVYGIKFVLDVQGYAGKLCLLPILIKCMAGLGLLTLVKISSECIMLRCLKARKEIKQKKYLLLKGDRPCLLPEYSYKEIII